MDYPGLPSVDEPTVNANTLFAWLEEQPENLSADLAEALFVQLLERSAKSRASSVNACTKLCGFVQHAARSGRPPVRAWAFRESTARRLFHFFLEWNEMDQHRSMKLVLDLVALLVVQNPDPATTGAALRARVLQTLVATIGHHTTRPLVKSAIGALHHLLGKRVYAFEDVAQAYSDEVAGDQAAAAAVSTATESSRLAVWRRFVQDLFAWMTLHYVCPAAGKLLVAVFAYLRTAAASGNGANTALASFTVGLWLRWLRDSLSVHPGILEDVKLYFFIPLFKTDRAGSLQLLESLNHLQPGSPDQTDGSSSSSTGDGALDADSATILQLAALEVGKKAGLVDDPGLNLTGKPPRGIALNETVLDDVLACSSHNVRSLALSLLVSSQSTTKPYSPTAFALLQTYLPGYHAESDAKFRYELLSHTRDMAVRLKSAITAMQRLLQQHRQKQKQQQQEQHQHQHQHQHQRQHQHQHQHQHQQHRHATDRHDAETKAEPAVAIDDHVVEHTLAEHEAFLTWYVTFLRGELAPTASYQRHFTALKATSWLLRLRRDVSGGSSDALDLPLARRLFHDGAWIRCVLDLLMDPFDDVRETAASLLVLLPKNLVRAPVFPAARSSNPSPFMPSSSSSPSHSCLWDVLVEFSRRAELLASRTARADHADGAARCQGLLCSWADGLATQTDAILGRVLDVLEAKIAKAEQDLGTAAVKSPVHGEFASIRYIWDVLTRSKYSEEELSALATIQERIVRSCQRIWHVVRHVLCDDSPEGHLPEELEDAVVGLDSKDLLSFSFRSINESSNTMRSIVGHLRFSRAEGTLCPSRPVFEAIGSLAFEQLSSLRHRGALTTVTQTFILCCQMAQNPLITAPDTPEDQTLVVTWYKGTLDCIASQVSTTRRSAGIPGLFCGILASNALNPSFDDAIAKVCAVAQLPAHVRETDGSRLPQVHALNCLREVFRSSLLSKRAERLLPACLQLAANSLRSEVWAIRNCGLLLLRSLIDCLFGAGESKAMLESGWDGQTIRVSYNKYPSLPGVLLRLLQSTPDVAALPKETVDVALPGHHLQIESQKAAAESVFPALDILRRAGPPEMHRDALFRAVVHYLGSHLWHVREMAARTVCSFLINQDWAAGLQGLVAGDGGGDGLPARPISSANRLHGTLLSVRFLLGRVAETVKADVADKLPQILSLVDTLALENSLVSSCPEVEAAYLEARNTVCGLVLRYGLDLGFAFASDEPEVAVPSDDGLNTTSALLRIQCVLRANYAAVAHNDREALQRTMTRICISDPDTATRLLDALPGSWFVGDTQTPDVAGWLCDVFVAVCRQAKADPLVRATALRHLADTLDYLLLLDDDSRRLPDSSQLASLWASVSQSGINPTLSCAVLRVSGPLLAAVALPMGGGPTTPGQQQPRQHAKENEEAPFSVAAWAAMMSHAGEADQTFDTRLAAAEALRSFALAAMDHGAFVPDDESVSSSSSPLSPVLADDALLPFVSCVYDSLNDDDDEIRDVAASAASAVLGTLLIPGEAARRLPFWMAARFGGRLPAFRAEAMGRMEGQGPHMEDKKVPAAAHGRDTAAVAWPPAASLLAAALQFDDALFIVEEQNLFVDEVREAQRWAGVVRSCADYDDDNDNAARAELVAWLADGLQALVERVARVAGDEHDDKDDGPLGWTTTPGVFAVCARLVIGARTLVEAAAGSSEGAAFGIDRLAELLAAFSQAGEAARLHGLILDMARI
ncbi:heat repeat protein [Niveomyces insectorum RCEF 264]|uniref:Heat repeat protein n=1 Tax=Niveomyces insectorum RCEF 264 TaxID=1081102 RepID=A0A162LBI7_9HYPO|nr:heat repeat protein [Niveomyces insectorum RCEF 264]